MARAKDKNGLTHQQELFCQYVVDAYGTETRGILVNAYRKAYNCKSDKLSGTHYVDASRLMDNPKITLRIEQLREERDKVNSYTKERMMTRLANILDADPLRLLKQDETTDQYVFKRLNEIPLNLRKLVTPTVIKGRMVYILDKKSAEQHIVKLLGYESAKDINLNTNSWVGELSIGFDDED